MATRWVVFFLFITLCFVHSTAVAATDVLGGTEVKGALRITVTNGTTTVERHDGSGWRNVSYDDASSGFAHYNTALAYPRYDESYGIVGVEPTRDLDFEYELKSQKQSGDTITTVFEDPDWYELKQEVTYSGAGSAYDIRYELTNLANEGYWFRLFRYHSASDGAGGVAQGSGYYRASADEVGVNIAVDGEEIDYSIRAVTPSRGYQAGDYEAVRAGVIDAAGDGLDATVDEGGVDAGYAMQWSSGGNVLANGGTWVVEFRERFEAWSVVSDPYLTEDDAGNMAFRFDTHEALRSASSAIAVRVDGPNTANVYSFDRDDFSLSGRNPFTYTLTTRQAFDDGPGTYTARVDDAITRNRRDGADGTSIDTHELQRAAAAPETSEIRATSLHAADGVDAARVTIRLRDANGRALQSGGDRVQVEATGSASVSSVTDNNDGTYTASVTNSRAGTVAVSATVNGRAISTASPRVEFRADSASERESVSATIDGASTSADDPDATSSILSLTRPHMADGEDASMIVVRLKDANGNDLPTGGEQVEVNVTGSAEVSAVTDYGDGTYSATVTNNVAETVEVSASVNGQSITASDRDLLFFPCAGWRKNVGEC
ncbi:MAG: Ig-like domain-containing protein [Ectothiorhodospiraceae bacterium]